MGGGEVLPRLVHIGEIRFNLGEVSDGGQTPRGRRIFCPILGGHLQIVHPLPEGFGISSDATSPLQAEVLPGGGDYPLIHNKTIAELNVSVVAKAYDNGQHLFHITSFGKCEYNQVVLNMLSNSPNARSSQAGEVDAWQVFRFNTSSPEYTWLNWSCVIGQERLLYEDNRLAATQMKLFQFLVK